MKSKERQNLLHWIIIELLQNLLKIAPSERLTLEQVKKHPFYLGPTPSTEELIKIMEDIRVDYDGTVRNANDKLIQCVYGDNGINTEKQMEQKIELIILDNKLRANWLVILK